MHGAKKLKKDVSNDVSYCLQIVEYLLDMAEVKADAHDMLTGETALTVAASNGCHSACAVLLPRGASVSAVNRKVSSKYNLALLVVSLSAFFQIF